MKVVYRLHPPSAALWKSLKEEWERSAFGILVIPLPVFNLSTISIYLYIYLNIDTMASCNASVASALEASCYGRGNCSLAPNSSYPTCTCVGSTLYVSALFCQTRSEYLNYVDIILYMVRYFKSIGDLFVEF